MPVYDDFSEKPNDLLRNCRIPRFSGIPLAQCCLPVDIDNFTDYCPVLSTDPRARHGGRTANTAHKTRDSDHGIMRSQDESSKHLRTID